MPVIDRTNADTLEQLLQHLPSWGDSQQRHTWLHRTLVEHAHWLAQVSGLEGSGHQAAQALVVAFGHDLPTDEQGLTPLCRLLRTMDEQNLVNRARLRPLLAAFACTQGLDPRPIWYGAPYPGMLAFQSSDRPIFFGREAETRALLERMASAGEPNSSDPEARCLLVIGPSGCGKSSLVRAGVWGALADGVESLLEGRFAETRRWLIEAMLPTDPEPFAAFVNALDRAAGSGLRVREQADLLRKNADDPDSIARLFARLLARQPADARCLLIVDQMEELFTAACDASRDDFLRLLRAALACEPRLQIVATLRSDFYPALEAQPWLQRLLNRAGASYNVPRPGAEELAQMIRKPLSELCLVDADGQPRPIAIEDALVRELLRDSADAQGNLALLAFALQARFQAALDGSGCMSLQGYRDAGGLAGILRDRADQALQRFRAEQGLAADAEQSLYCEVFSHLVAIRPEDGTPTRQRARLADFKTPQARALIQALSGEDARLLVCGPQRADGDTGEPDDRVEVTHEALFRAWPVLAAWIEAYREALMRRDGVRREAERWAMERRDALLPRAELIADLHRQLSAKGLWEDLIKEPNPARFLARDHVDELWRLVLGEYEAGAADPPAAATAARELVRLLTNEDRSWTTMQGLGARIADAEPELVQWLRSGLELALARLGEPDALDWYGRRPALGDLLAVLGDRRAGVGVGADGLPDILWREVSGGEVSQFGRTRSLAGFRIACYPITNSQYQVFRDAEDDAEPAWWFENWGAPAPIDSDYTQPNRPRTNVCWLEALAYCRWLTSHLKAAGGLAQDEQITLPTEDQWLLAAAGSDGRRYPWGNDWETGIANCNEAEDAMPLALNLRQTTAVGLYPRGDSPAGLADCAGNVWEWCLNKDDDPDDTGIDTASPRGLRGGGWGSGRGGVAVSARIRGNSVDRGGFVGFRVCVARSP
jgi:formylglycine-generating enzyme required for sulfatase activity